MTAPDANLKFSLSSARDALASIFETGFEHAEEGRPYDYADETIRRMEVAGYEFCPSGWGEYLRQGGMMGWAGERLDAMRDCGE